MSRRWLTVAESFASDERELFLAREVWTWSSWSELDAWVASAPEAERAERLAEVRETLHLCVSDLYARRFDAAAVRVGTEGRPSIFFVASWMRCEGLDPWVQLGLLEEARRGSASAS